MSKKHEFYMWIALKISEQSTCLRWKVWAVIVKNDCICSTWYNGAARGLPACNTKWCQIIDWHCCRTLHSEENAILQAARLWVSIHWAKIYCTHRPCQMCFQRLINSWIKEVIYQNDYKWDYFYEISEYKWLEVYQYKNWNLSKILSY